MRDAEMKKEAIEKKIGELFTAIGAMVELWNVTFKEFKKVGYSDVEAIEHTRELMKLLLFKNNQGEETTDELS